MKACQARQDRVFRDVGDALAGEPRGVYHRECYQRYTHRRAVDKAVLAREEEERRSTSFQELHGQEAQDADAEVADGSATVRTRTSRRQSSPLDIKKCLFCQLDDKKQKGAKRRLLEPLTRCATFTASNSIQHAAEVYDDERLLPHIRGKDLIALEACYHMSCYKMYCSSRALHYRAMKDVEKENSTCRKAHEKAFVGLVQFVEDTILCSRAAKSMVYTTVSSVRDRYVSLLGENGYDTPAGYHSHLVKARLVDHFGSRLKFHRPARRNTSEIVFSAELPTGPMLELLTSMKEAEDDDVDPLIEHESYRQDLADDDSCVYHCALKIRGDILSMKNTLPLSPTTQQLAESRNNIPPSLHNFLAWVFDGAPDSSSDDFSVSVSERVPVNSEVKLRHVQSLSQDIIHCATGGRIKCGKHVSLAVSMHHLTGSAAIVTILNRFGHCVSYSQLSEILTAMAEEVVNSNALSRSYVPSNIHGGSFVSLAWDNNDINEETLSGTGTTHCTNGIAIQRSVAQTSPALPQDTGVRRQSTRRRSIEPPPVVIPDFPTSARIGPQPLPSLDGGRGSLEVCGKLLLPYSRVDFLWFLLRLIHSVSAAYGQCGQQVVPGWSGFMSIMNKDVKVQESAVGYMPVIPSSPTQLGTVYLLLRRSMDLANQLGQPEIVVVLDQAIYAKAVEIMWKQPQEFSRIVLRMGAFHIACTFMSVIGKRFADAGLLTLCVESGIVGAGAVNQALDGKMYNRAVRLHKVLFEAFSRRLWESFEERYGEASMFQDPELFTCLSVSRLCCSHSSVAHTATRPGFTSLLRLYEMFLQSLDTGLARFWLSYLQMVEVLLMFIRSCREGNWELHLASIRHMLPWLFAYDRTNYSRYLSFYYMDMMTLESRHSYVHRQLCNGNFVVQRSSNSFAQVPMDQCIEQTVNKDTKTQGGIIGFSCRPGSVQKWIATAHRRAEVTNLCRGFAGLVDDEGSCKHKETTSKRLQKDEADVLHALNVLHSWQNPFALSLDEPDASIVNLSSGVAASEDVASDLLAAQCIGNTAFEEFVAQRLTSSSVSFFDVIHKLKLKTFRNMKRSKTVGQGDRAVVMSADRDLFARMLVICQSRQLDLRNVLTYCLGPLPLALATADGSLNKTDKAKLLHILEDDSVLQRDTVSNAVYLFDGMAVLQSLSPSRIPATFGGLSDLVFSIIMKPFEFGSERVDFVTDCYFQHSIKTGERARRQGASSHLIKISRRDQPCPRLWKSFLANSTNKMELIRYFLSDWKCDRFSAKLLGHSLYISCGDECFLLTSLDGKVTETNRIADLCSTQEEADTKLFLHASHACSASGSSGASSTNQSVVIVSPDTDVAVIGVTMMPSIPVNKLYFKTGSARSAAGVRFVDIGKVRSNVGDSMSNAMLGFHALTGCDSTSAFFGKGKRSAFNVLKKSPASQEALAQLGSSFTASSELVNACEEFVCRLYGDQKASSINDVRYSLFTSRGAQASQLPPTRDSLLLHIQRANYQAGIWRRCLNSAPDVPSPANHGWEISDDVLTVVWMNQDPAPREVLAFVSCGCSTDCTTARCSCIKAGLVCTDICRCSEAKCENRRTHGDSLDNHDGSAGDHVDDHDEDEAEEDL